MPLQQVARCVPSLRFLDRISFLPLKFSKSGVSPKWTKSAPLQTSDFRLQTSDFRLQTVPILPKEPDCLPGDLLEDATSESSPWWLLYTKSRQEKSLMRHLRVLDLPHYGPLVMRRHRQPNGRIRTIYSPLFNNYLFLRGDDEARYQAICTGCVTKAAPITETLQLVTDLRQIRDLIDTGAPLTVESRLEAGQNVRVKTGAFAGFEGTIVRRENETRLLVAVRFMDQGVSVKLDDCQLEPL